MRTNRLLYPEAEGGASSDAQAAGEEEKDGSSVERAEELQTALSTAIGKYREMVAAGPGLVPGMIGGSTIEEVDASVAAAKQAYSEISRRITERYERDISAGNPSRSAATLAAETLKPEAKIALGLARAEQ
ncbi:MAG: hypothetical protein IVW55_17820 [Chloroflexi bacterium]|nr:hypothetical protein [Chloroflexota bacterium]